MSNKNVLLEFGPSSVRSGLHERPDTALVRWIAEGSSPALGAFYDRWAARVYALVSRVVKDPDDAEQVVEATFWHAWRTASTYDANSSSVADWLLKIVRRKGVEHLRAKRQSRKAMLALTTSPTLRLQSSRRESRVLELAIPDADLCHTLRKAVEAAALNDARSMEALHEAVQDFTLALRDAGTTPEGVLMSLRTIIQNESLPDPQESSGWRTNQLPHIVSAWSIDEFFDKSKGATRESLG